MANGEIKRNLNYDCLEHLFPFLTPKEWPHFAQVCKTWNQSVFRKDFQELRYVENYSDFCGHEVDTDTRERLEVSEFLQILELVAPKLKYAKIMRTKLKSAIKSDVIVSFGHFEYTMRVNRNEEEDFMKNIFLKKTKNVEKLKINTFDGTTVLEWEQFFQSNPVNYFRFFAENSHSQATFFHDYLPILPNKLQQIVLDFSTNWMTDDKQQQILQFLQKLPLLSKVHLGLHDAISPMIVTEVSKHCNTMKELCLDKPLDEMFEDSDGDTGILSIIPTFTKLTKLCLTGFILSDEDLCRQIVESCQSIRCLKLLYSEVSEECLQVLMSLPNLSELYINPIPMNLTTEVKNLKKLVIDNDLGDIVVTENLANALALMPNLTSLTLCDELCHEENSFIETAVRKIKKIIHSRRQNIVLYSSHCKYRVKNCDTQKVGEIPCKMPTSKEFAIFMLPHSPHMFEILASD